MLYVVIFIAGFLLSIVYLQFTVVAGIAAIAGFTGLLSKPRHPVEEILCIVLLFVSSLIRFQSFGLVLVMFAPVYGFLIITYVKDRQWKKDFLWLWKIVGVTFIAFALNRYNASVQEHYLFVSYIVKMCDYHLLNEVTTEVQEAIFQEIAWSRNDYEMLIKWAFMDKNLYNTEIFKKIITKLPLKNFNDVILYLNDEKTLQDTVDILRLPIILHLVLFFIAFAIFDISPKKLIFYTGIAAYFFVMYHLIAFFLKPPPERVFIVMYMATCLSPFIIHMSERGKGLADYIKIPYAFVFVILISLYPIQKILRDTRYTLLHQWKNYQKSKATQIPFRTAVIQLAQQIGGNKSLLVSWGAAFPFESIKPFEDIFYLKQLNIFSLGWGQQLPASERMLQKFQITDLYTAIAERPDVYLLIGSYFQLKELELYRNYMREHYGKEVEWQQLHNPLAAFNGSSLFKISFTPTTPSAAAAQRP